MGNIQGNNMVLKNIMLFAEEKRDAIGLFRTIVSNGDILTVYDIYTVRVIAPLSKHVDAVYFYVETMEEIYAPNCGIGKSHAFYCDIFTIVKFDVAICIRLVTMLRNAFFAAIIEDTISIHTNIVRILSKKTAIYECVFIYVNTLIGF